MTFEDEQACHRLCVDYVHFIDACRFKEFSELFTEDGLLELPARRMQGRAEIFGILSQRPAGVLTMHFCTSTRIEAAGDEEARGSTYAMIFRHEGGAEPAVLPVPMMEPLSTGIYEDAFLRTPAGWRFRSRRMRAFFRRQ